MSANISQTMSSSVTIPPLASPAQETLVGGEDSTSSSSTTTSAVNIGAEGVTVTTSNGTSSTISSNSDIFEDESSKNIYNNIVNAFSDGEISKDDFDTYSKYLDLATKEVDKNSEVNWEEIVYGIGKDKKDVKLAENVKQKENKTLEYWKDLFQDTINDNNDCDNRVFEIADNEPKNYIDKKTNEPIAIPEPPEIHTPEITAVHKPPEIDELEVISDEDDNLSDANFSCDFKETSENKNSPIERNSQNQATKITVNGKVYDLSDYSYSKNDNGTEFYCLDDSSENLFFYINEERGEFEIRQNIDGAFCGEKYNLKGELIAIDPLGGDSAYADVEANKDGTYTDVYGAKYTQAENGHYESSTSEAGFIAQEIYNNLTNKNSLGITAISDELINSAVKKITPENVNHVLMNYEYLNEESLITTLMEESFLSREQRTQLTQHITNCMLENARNNGVNVDDLCQEFNKAYKKENNDILGFFDAKQVKHISDKLNGRIRKRFEEDDVANGQIDKNFGQGYIGDCFALAAINSIASTPNGLKLLNDSIEILEDGSVKINLKGADKEYIVSQEELNRTDEYSSGDMDVRAFEIALNRYYEETSGTIEQGGQSRDIYQILLGKDDSGFWSGRKGEVIFNKILPNGFTNNDELLEKLNNENYVCVASTEEGDNSSAVVVDDDDNLVQLAPRHAYSVMGADDKYVYLQNPWNTSKTLKMTIQEFRDYFHSIETVDLTNI